MAKTKTLSYILNLKLETEKFEEDILSKRFEIGRQIYNSVLGVALKRHKEMIKTRVWRETQSNISEVYKTEKDDKKRKKLCKDYFAIKKELLNKYELSEYSLHKIVKSMQNHYKNNIDAFTAQKIASRVWIALEDVLFGEGEKIKFKNYNNGLNSLEGKSNKAGISYKLDTHLLKWSGLSIKVQSKLNDYEINALRDKVKYCRVVRKFIRGKYKYTLQLVLEGIPPIKTNKKTGEIKNDIGMGDCGIDIGTQTIAYTSNFNCKLYELAPRVQNIEDEKRGVKLAWNYSNRYIKAKNRLKDLYRKQADIRKMDHNILANEILTHCDTIKVETMNFKGLQKRAKHTEKNDKGKFKKKKRFGKSLANKAPSMFLTILENKLKAKGGLYIEINTFTVKASQYNHFSQECKKKKLSQRWNYFEYNNKEIKVQRDLYSSYLIKNVDGKETINNDKCIKDFDRFLEMHDVEIKRLLSYKNLSSMGI